MRRKNFGSYNVSPGLFNPFYTLGHNREYTMSTYIENLTAFNGRTLESRAGGDYETMDFSKIHNNAASNGGFGA